MRYVLGVSLFGLALSARFALVGVLPDRGFPFLTFFPAVILAAFLAGFGPGVMTAILSTAAAWYFFMPPAGSFAAMSGPDAVALVFFSVILLIDCIVIDLMNRALDRVHRTQRLLHASEHRLRHVLDQLFVAAGVLDLDGTLRQLNGALLRLAALDRQRAVGRKFWDVLWDASDPARQGQVRDAIARASRGEAVRFDLEQGGALAGQRTLDFQVAPLRDEEGRITALVASGVEVTSRVQALKDLERSRSEALEAARAAERERRVLDATFNAVPAGIIVADATGRLVRMNRATERIWGPAPYSQDVASYGEWKGWWAGDSPRAGQRLASHEWGLARSLRGEHCTDLVEVEPFDRPGERLVTQLSSAPVLDPGGQVVGGVVVQIDITARIEAEKALRAADRQKDTFLATLSHELRNPLAPIRAGAHLIGMSHHADERVRKAAAVIERQSSLLTRLVDDLLDVSRLQFGNLTLQKTRVDLRRVVEAGVETSRPMIEAYRLDFQLRLPDTPLWVDVDEVRLGQCISNLVNNACKFTPAPGRVGLQVQALGTDRVSVCVSDSGQGIPSAMQGKIFEMFAQERRSGMGGNTGLGIGLALTRKLVEMHGGQIRVHSEGQGRGAQFEIVLSLAEAPMQAPAVEAGQAVGSH